MPEALEGGRCSWYLGPQGKEADFTKAMAAAPAPDLVLFNGVANQYKDHPVGVTTGGQVRFFVLETVTHGPTSRDFRPCAGRPSGARVYSSGATTQNDVVPVVPLAKQMPTR
jgi:hypothetical protein